MFKVVYPEILKYPGVLLCAVRLDVSATSAPSHAHLRGGPASVPRTAVAVSHTGFC